MAARTQTSRSKAVMPDESSVSPIKEETTPIKTPKPTKIRLDDSVLVRVKSNTFGQLIYINKRTGDRTEWKQFGEEQSLSMGDLRAMKGTQLSFFSDQMIVITGCEDDRYPDLTPADIYDALLVSRYYKNIVDPENFGKIFAASDSEIRQMVSQMSNNARTNLIVALNTAINNGTLDSLRKIKLFESLLGCELASLQ